MYWDQHTLERLAEITRQRLEPEMQRMSQALIEAAKSLPANPQLAEAMKQIAAASADYCMKYTEEMLRELGKIGGVVDPTTGLGRY